MYIEISRGRIVIKGTLASWDIQYVLRELTSILLERGYRPYVYFSGTPVRGGEGMVVDMVLDRELSRGDYELVKKIVVNLGVRLVERGV